MNMLFMEVSLSSVVVFIFAFAMCAFLASSLSPFKIMDTPNERSLHNKPIPRVGGIGILMSLLLAWFVGMHGGGLTIKFYYGVPGLVFLLAIVSFIDDLFSLSFVIRLFVHFVTGYVLVFHLVNFPELWLWKIIACVAVVWMINLYNFMDGMDGFAGGMGVLGFTFLGIAALQAEAVYFAQISFTIAAANLGFLIWNFPPAKIFMGDVGSTSMGFLAAVMSLWGIRDNLFPFWFPFLVFSPFIYDATFTLLRRILRGEEFWRAHKIHLYQQLVQIGWGHKRTVLAEYLLMFIVCLTSLLVIYLKWQAQIFFLCGWFLLYIFLSFAINSRYNKVNGK